MLSDDEDDDEDIVGSSFLGGSSSATTTASLSTFAALGVPAPLCKSLSALSIKSPSIVQQLTIPAILSGSSIIAISATGSGKTLAFLLPILTRLAIDPYGVYAIVLSPTRELAGQIEQQLKAVGGCYGVKSALITGGGDVTLQSCNLKELPHFVVATPGRLSSMIKNNQTPRLSNVRFVVLDEADRLLSLRSNSGFFADINHILGHISSDRSNVQMLLYSATITEKLDDVVESLRSSVGGKRFQRIVCGTAGEEKEEKKEKEEEEEEGVSDDSDADSDDDGKGSVEGSDDDDEGDEDDEQAKKEEKKETKKKEKKAGGAESSTDPESAPKIPSGLKQEYIYMPHTMRDIYLATTIRNVVANGGVRPNVEKDEFDKSGWDITKRDEDDDIHSNGLARSAIIFVGSCERSAHLEGTFRELGVDCVALHSLLSQDRRNAALGKFKSQQVKILIATDVASRGLDIPEVDLVVNAELPRKAQDYIHRVGRTARAGRRGLAISLVGEEDVSLIHACEKLSGRELTKCDRVSDRDCLKIMSSVAKASRLTKVKLMEIGFKELVKKHEKRKAKAKKERAKMAKVLDGQQSGGGGGKKNKKQKT